MGLDHVVLGARELERGRRDLADAGFSPSGGGVHVGKGTANELVRLSTGYLEILTVVDPSEALAYGGSRKQVVDFLEAVPSGLLGYALEVADIAETREALAGRGVSTSGPHSMTRIQPDGRRIGWRTALIDDRQWLTPHPFLIQWDDVDRWGASTDRHPNGVTRVSSVTVASADLAASREVYTALGADVVDSGQHEMTLTLADLTIRVQHPRGHARASVGLLSVSFAVEDPADGEFLPGRLVDWLGSGQRAD